MRRSNFLALLPFLALPAMVQAAAPGSSITADSVKAHVSFLADDLLEGHDLGLNPPPGLVQTVLVGVEILLFQLLGTRLHVAGVLQGRLFAALGLA